MKFVVHYYRKREKGGQPEVTQGERYLQSSPKGDKAVTFWVTNKLCLKDPTLALNITE